MTLRTLAFKSLAALAFTAAAASSAFATSNPPAGMVAINYNRCDNNYTDWGLHLWQRGPGGPAIPGVTWASPMMPTGKTDFGVFWHAKLSDFPEGKVNYIIHKGDNKDQGGRDMQFDGNASKEIWVNNGDRKIYTSLDDARKARAADPCK
jgi:hypothetical protein